LLLLLLLLLHPISSLEFTLLLLRQMIDGLLLVRQI